LASKDQATGRSDSAVELVKFQHRRLKSGWEKNLIAAQFVDGSKSIGCDAVFAD